MTRRRHTEQPSGELNLAPIMNMVMILIPLLLLSTVFLKAGVVDVRSPRSSHAATPDDEEAAETDAIPQVTVFVSEQGFFLSDQRNAPAFAPFAAPVAGCGTTTATSSRAPTVCVHTDVSADAPLVQRLDYAGLYNTLVRIRLHSDWADGFSREDNDVIRIVADPNVPFEAIIATMDTARYFVQPGESDVAIPGPGADAAAYALPTGRRGATALANAAPLSTSTQTVEPVPLFPHPVLLTALPRGKM